jgi:hypothetical protein
LITWHSEKLLKTVLLAESTLAVLVVTLNPGVLRGSSPAKAEPNQTSQTPNAQTAADGLSVYMSKVRQRNHKESDLYLLSMRYGTALLPYLKAYARDADPNIASQATTSMFFLLKDARTPADRREIVTCLAAMLQEGYETGREWDVERPMLAFSKADDFSPTAQQVLHILLARVNDRTYKNPYQIEKIILLVGIADMQSELPLLQELISRWDGGLREMHQREIDKWHRQVAACGERIPPRLQLSGELLQKKTYWQGSILWDALRARARMGTKEDTRRCIEMAESHPDPDYRAAYLFDQLAYIRQPEVAEYLRGYLSSNRTPARGGNDVVVMSDAARAASALAGMLEDAPIKRYQTLPKDILVLRNWMAEQTKWRIVR